jgi:hypothetical protein
MELSAFFSACSMPRWESRGRDLDCRVRSWKGMFRWNRGLKPKRVTCLLLFVGVDFTGMMPLKRSRSS